MPGLVAEENMAWLYLVLASFFEVGWAISLKYSQGFTRPIFSAFVVLGAILSLYFLGLAANHIPIGTAYATWTGIGTVGTAILGMILFAESHHWVRLASILLIVIGITALRVFSPK